MRPRFTARRLHTPHPHSLHTISHSPYPSLTVLSPHLAITVLTQSSHSPQSSPPSQSSQYLHSTRFSVLPRSSPHLHSTHTVLVLPSDSPCSYDSSPPDITALRQFSRHPQSSSLHTVLTVLTVHTHPHRALPILTQFSQCPHTVLTLSSHCPPHSHLTLRVVMYLLRLPPHT